LDSGFGTGGIVTRAASGPSTIAGAFAVVLQPQPGGEIVVAGYD
jgi:energy-coupling factor transporter ATP-binding protein EcfA2